MISSYPTTSYQYHIISHPMTLCFWVCASGNEVIKIISYSPTVRSTAGRDLPCPFCQVAAAGCTRDVAEATQEGQFSQVRASRQSEMGFASWVQCWFFGNFLLIQMTWPMFLFLLILTFCSLKFWYILYMLYIVCIYCIYGNIYIYLESPFTVCFLGEPDF